jgi:titin
MKTFREQALWVVGVVFLLTPIPSSAQKPGEIIPGHYLVRFEADSPDPALAAQELSRAHGFRVRHVYRFALRGMAIEIPTAAELQILSALRRNPHVRSIGNDRYINALAQIIPKGMRRIKGEPGVGANTGNGLRLAVVDSGLDFTHPDLAGNIDTNLSVSCVSDNGTCVPGGQDDVGHGTFVGGLIAAVNNSIDIVGLGPEITLISAKVIKSNGTGSFADITAAVDYLTGLNLAGTRIDVVNMSLGATCPTCTDDSTDPSFVLFHDAVRALIESGTTVVVSSGNDGQNAQNTLPAAYDEVITTSALADSDGQPGGFGPPICVAPFFSFCLEFGDDDSFALFANFGADVDVIAPGVEETSLQLGGGTINGENGSGTSFSSPHAAGVAALYIRDRLNRGEPPPEPATVRQALIETGECHEGSGTVFHGQLGCSEVWPGDPDGIPEPLVRADNIANFGGPAPANDIAVTSISVRSPVAANSAESVDVGVTNQGTEDETFSVSLSDDVESFSVGGSPQTITLAAGAATTVTFGWTPSMLGTHALTATAGIVAGEIDIADNTKVVNVSVLEPTHDVAVTSITAPATVAEGNTADVSVEVANEGTFDETFTVSVVDQPPSGGTAGTLSGAQTITLTSGSATVLTFSWDTTGATLGVHTLTATVAPVPDENDTTDNSKSISTTINKPPATAPGSLVATAVSSSQIELSWIDTTDNEDGFKIERCSSSASNCGTDPAKYQQIAQTGPNATSFSDASVSDDSYYTYRVRAFNVAGDSPYSNIDDALTPLAPPSNLVAVAVSTSQIDLSWQDNSNDEISMRIFRCVGTATFCDANPSNFVEVIAVGANNTSWSNTGLSPDTTYSYRVRASNINGYSDPSNTAQATTLAVTSPPNAPSSLSATAASTSMINLSWQDNSGDETGFRLERCQGAGCSTFAQVIELAANITGYSDTGLVADTTYSYRVRAFNAAGDSAYSNTAQATTNAAATAPAAPSNLVATAVSSSQINLTWQDNSSNELNMRVDRCLGTAAFCDANPDNFAEIIALGANNTSWSNTGLNPDTTYSYRVRGTNTNGSSAPSNTAEATTDPLSSVPNAPSNLVAVAVFTSQIDLTWQDNSTDEINMRVDRCLGTATFCDANPGNFAEVTALGANNTSWSNTGLSPDTTYSYRVRATNPNGSSAPSNTAEATTLAITSPPAAPSGLNAISASTSKINLSWQDNAGDELGFRVERCQGAGCSSFTQVIELAANTTVYPDTGLAADTTYSYRVLAFNTAGDSAYSNTAQATTHAPPSAPNAPSNLVAVAVSTTQVDLTWQDNSNDEISMRVDRCQGTAAFCDANPGNFAEVTALGANNTSWSNTGLSPDTTYSYRVRATNTNGSSAPSNTAEATTNPLAAMPNPPSSLLAVAASTSQIDLSWQDNSGDEAGFRLERCQGASCSSFAPVIELAANAIAYSDTSLAAGTTFRYRILAFNVAGESAYSNTSEATTQSILTPPTAPSDLVAVSGGGGKGKKATPPFVDLAWQDNSSNEDSFLVERCAVEGKGRNKTCAFSVLAIVSADVASYHDASVAKKTKYRYRVKAQNSAGDSGYSNEAEINTP